MGVDGSLNLIKLKLLVHTYEQHSKIFPTQIPFSRLLHRPQMKHTVTFLNAHYCTGIRNKYSSYDADLNSNDTNSIQRVVPT